MKFDRQEIISENDIDYLLSESKVVQKLTKDYEDNHFFNLFRLISLSEIPYIERLPYTKKVLSYVSNNLATSDGFSYTGKPDYIVPCYNAMLLEAYSRLGKSDSIEVQNALNWIKKYQVFERNQSTAWKEKGICKHGGCMNAVPCFIGIGKTIRALITYAEVTGHTDSEVEKLIEKGTAYMLRHKMYQRLSNHLPISAHIQDIVFPQAYMLSLTDLVYIAGKSNLWELENLQPLKQLLQEKGAGHNEWKIDYIYSHKGYKNYDGRRKPSEWISYLFKTSLET